MFNVGNLIKFDEWVSMGDCKTKYFVVLGRVGGGWEVWSEDGIKTVYDWQESVCEILQ